jgi:hypothetical protein
MNVVVDREIVGHRLSFRCRRAFSQNGHKKQQISLVNMGAQGS